MHGLRDVGLPPDCASDNVPGLIQRGDAVVGRLVERLRATAAWKAKENMAIVVTFDEGAGGVRGGCCAVTPDAPSNYGGGHIPTIVITNHGPRGVTDRRPYNHYSLLRTFEDAFGIKRHLRHAGDGHKGVVSMTPLFAVRRSR
jgi:arylsulfatase A-like enzyme